MQKNVFFQLARLIEKPSLGAFVYGSVAVYGSIERANDIDIFNLCPGRSIHKRIVKQFHGKEIHEYYLSEDVINADIFCQMYGEMHSCNFWGPIVPLHGYRKLDPIIRRARIQKIRETLLFLRSRGHESITIQELIEQLFYIEGILRPYAFNIGRKIYGELMSGCMNKTKQWRDEFGRLLRFEVGHDLLVPIKGRRFLFKKKNQEDASFAKLYSDRYVNVLRFWKTYVETHEGGWDDAMKHATKHYGSLPEIDEYISTISRAGFPVSIKKSKRGD